MSGIERSGWYGVRCVFRTGGAVYEERVTLWQAADEDAAIALAEREAREHAADLHAAEHETVYTGLAQSYTLVDAPGQGAEVFSLTRTSDLPPNEYLDRFFDTGAENQRPT